MDSRDNFALYVINKKSQVPSGNYIYISYWQLAYKFGRACWSSLKLYDNGDFSCNFTGLWGLQSDINIFKSKWILVKG